MKQTFTDFLHMLTTKIDGNLIMFLVTIGLSLVVYTISNKVIDHITDRFLKKCETVHKKRVGYYIAKHAQLRVASMLSFVIALYVLSTQNATTEKLFYKASSILFIAVTLKIFSGVSEGIVKYSEADVRFQGKSYRSFSQVILILAYIACGIIIIGIITEKSPNALLAGLGAVAAVISLMFRETILSFVSSLQISAYDLIRKGDWISIPDMEVDGEVIEVSLHEIKVQNWDNSVSSVTTTGILNSNFKNWRNMQELGARRIMRSINLDVNSVKFIDKKLKTQLEEFKSLQQYFSSLESYYDFSGEKNQPHITNLQAFKWYAEEYLKTVPELRKDLLFTARIVEVTERGLVFGIYGFSSKTTFVDCEAIVLKIISELLSVLHYFELKPFQLKLQNNS